MCNTHTLRAGSAQQIEYFWTQSINTKHCGRTFSSPSIIHHVTRWLHINEMQHAHYVTTHTHARTHSLSLSCCRSVTSSAPLDLSNFTSHQKWAFAVCSTAIRHAAPRRHDLPSVAVRSVSIWYRILNKLSFCRWTSIGIPQYITLGKSAYEEPSWSVRTDSQTWKKVTIACHTSTRLKVIIKQWETKTPDKSVQGAEAISSLRPQLGDQLRLAEGRHASETYSSSSSSTTRHTTPHHTKPASNRTRYPEGRNAVLQGRFLIIIIASHRHNYSAVILWRPVT